MASVMGICGGLAGPKSGNVEKPLVFVCFFDVFNNHGCLQERLQRSGPECFDVKKVIFVIKMLCGYIRNCASYAGGEHIFRKFMEKCCRKVKNGAKIMSDTLKYHPNGIGYMKMASKLCRIYH